MQGILRADAEAVKGQGATMRIFSGGGAKVTMKFIHDDASGPRTGIPNAIHIINLPSRMTAGSLRVEPVPGSSVAHLASRLVVLPPGLDEMSLGATVARFVKIPRLEIVLDNQKTAMIFIEASIRIVGSGEWIIRSKRDDSSESPVIHTRLNRMKIVSVSGLPSAMVQAAVGLTHVSIPDPPSMSLRDFCQAFRMSYSVDSSISFVVSHRMSVNLSSRHVRLASVVILRNDSGASVPLEAVSIVETLRNRLRAGDVTSRGGQASGVAVSYESNESAASRESGYAAAPSAASPARTARTRSSSKGRRPGSDSGYVEPDEETTVGDPKDDGGVAEKPQKCRAPVQERFIENIDANLPSFSTMQLPLGAERELDSENSAITYVAHLLTNPTSQETETPHIVRRVSWTDAEDVFNFTGAVSLEIVSDNKDSAVPVSLPAFGWLDAWRNSTQMRVDFDSDKDQEDVRVARRAFRGAETSENNYFTVVLMATNTSTMPVDLLVEERRSRGKVYIRKTEVERYNLETDVTNFSQVVRAVESRQLTAAAVAASRTQPYTWTPAQPDTKLEPHINPETGAVDTGGYDIKLTLRPRAGNSYASVTIIVYELMDPNISDSSNMLGAELSPAQQEPTGARLEGPDANACDEDSDYCSSDDETGNSRGCSGMAGRLPDMVHDRRNKTR